jgi:hypothetical protein
VGEVASSNLVVPTILLRIFTELVATIWLHLSAMTLYLVSYWTHLVGPIWPHLIDLLRIAFLA